MKYILALLIFLFNSVTPILASENNKVGIGILSPEADIEEAASMVNHNGDWGWVLLVIRRSEMNLDRWQGIFHKLSKSRLIPIVRIATEFNGGGVWQRPGTDDAKNWAEFLSSLYWPTKNRYVQVYNEVNRADEWGGAVDPEGYAKELSKTSAELKAKSDDFFILNAPLDLALSDSRSSMDAGRFFSLMEQSTPGIFEKLDGWASHSYPNPAFSASPFKSGRSGIDGYKWELSQIEPYSKKTSIPVFITETGWDRSKVGEEQTAQNFREAYEKVWNDERIVAVCPFIFDYPDGQYSSFSFKSNGQTLGAKYFTQYDTIRDLPKVKGNPPRDNFAGDVNFKFLDFVLVGQTTSGSLTLQNSGHYIWNRDTLQLNLDTRDMEIHDIVWDSQEILPGQETKVTFKTKSLTEGEFDFKIRLVDGEQFLLEVSKQIVSETFAKRLIRLFIDAV